MIQEDIDGAYHNKGECPIARAIKRQAEYCNTYVSVMLNNITIISNKSSTHIYKCSNRMNSFIRNYDNNEIVTPINFYLIPRSTWF